MTTGRVPAGRWVLVDPPRWTADICELIGHDCHHLTRVLRARKGEWIGLLNGQGGVARAQIVHISKHTVSLRVVERTAVPAPRPRITLYQAVLRENEMDRVIQACVELGVGRFVAVNAARVVVRWTGAKAAARRERWRRIVVESVKQSGQPWLPEIEGPVSLGEALADSAKATVRVFGALLPQAPPLRSVLRRNPGEPPESAAIYIGPEGDFTEEESHGLRSAGVLPVSLGAAILRAETAAVFAVSAVLYEWGVAAPSGSS